MTDDSCGAIVDPREEENDPTIAFEFEFCAQGFRCEWKVPLFDIETANAMLRQIALEAL